MIDLIVNHERRRLREKLQRRSKPSKQSKPLVNTTIGNNNVNINVNNSDNSSTNTSANEAPPSGISKAASDPVNNINPSAPQSGSTQSSSSSSPPSLPSSTPPLSSPSSQPQSPPSSQPPSSPSPSPSPQPPSSSPSPQPQSSASPPQNSLNVDLVVSGSNFNEQQNTNGSQNFNLNTATGAPFDTNNNDNNNNDNNNSNNNNDDANNTPNGSSGQTTTLSLPPLATMTTTPSTTTPCTPTISNYPDTNTHSHGSLIILAIILPIVILSLAGLVFFLKKKGVLFRNNPSYNHNAHRRLHDMDEWSETNSYSGEVQEISIPPVVRLSHAVNKSVSSSDELEQLYNASSFYSVRDDEKSSSRNTSGRVSSYNSRNRTPNQTTVYLEGAGLGQNSRHYSMQFQNTEQILTEPDPVLIIDGYTSEKRPENPFDDDYSFDDEVLDILISPSDNKPVNWEECMK